MQLPFLTTLDIRYNAFATVANMLCCQLFDPNPNRFIQGQHLISSDLSQSLMKGEWFGPKMHWLLSCESLKLFGIALQSWSVVQTCFSRINILKV